MTMIEHRTDGPEGVAGALRSAAASAPVVPLSALLALQIARRLEAGNDLCVAAKDVQALSEDRGRQLAAWRAVGLCLMAVESVRLMGALLWAVLA